MEMELDIANSSLVGKKVVVFKTDGFPKIGILISVDSVELVLDILRDEKVVKRVRIPMATISSYEEWKDD